ncbi:hypothetical protein Rsub_06850 [Raphidocelis subcapitata]|uniref:Uncharacterized protein n=1 Tax=Raphidocelis subcapitata TaxID=307507 RepID=A0A2V0P1U5_9CHLO|nr:hypothetical protein Rsub_06850 [Raphidocelis subcapitata]|eukprot:GBF93851.1 hypothetical protein Rsub_06850 [Raphidocelis subcapitata]
MRCTALAAALLLLVVGVAAADPPAWACGQLTDYYAKVTTECAKPECNAAQRNLAGDILVLDFKSYGTTQCQGCNPAIPATCCQACQETDGCNAWVICTNKDGCGSGCQAYAKQFSAPLGYSDKLPHKFWGNWGSCQEDKWRFGMCSLKVVKDTANPPVPADSKPSDGWVSGIVPKASIDSRCPPNFSAKTCKSCLGTKNPELCVSCVKSANTLDAASKCTTCASLPSAEGAAACVKCASSPAPDCARCLDVDCSDVDCLNKRNEDASKAPNLGSVDRCFACQAADASKAVACSSCFDTYTVATEGRGSCLSCVAGNGAAAASGCAGCHGQSVSNKGRCLDCLKRAKNQADGAGCGSCSSQRDAAPHAAACHECVLGAQDDTAKGLCSSLDAGSSGAAAAEYFKCLSAAKGSDAPYNCMQCYRMGNPASATACFTCLGKVGAGNGIHCSHCWSQSRMQEKKAEGCEQCVIGKDKGGGAGNDCWN